MQNKHMNINQSRGFEKNPYINQGENMQQKGINTMNTTMQTYPQTMQQNPYYNTNPVNTQTNPQQNSIDSLLGTFPKESTAFDTTNFLKGALIGAVGAYLLTNENAQKTIFKTFAKGSEFMGAAIEEIKERYEDAQAELEAQRNP